MIDVQGDWNEDRSIGAFECGRIYRVYKFRLGNNVRMTSQLVSTSRELVTKKAAQLSTFTLFPLSPVQEAGDNGIEKLLITLDHVSYTNYFMSIEISWCGVRLIKIAKPDKKQSVGKTHCIFSIWRNNYTLPGYRKRLRTVILIPRMQTSRGCEFMGVNPPSFPDLSHHTRTHHKLRWQKAAIIEKGLSLGEAQCWAAWGQVLIIIEHQPQLNGKIWGWRRYYCILHNWPIGHISEPWETGISIPVSEKR